MKARLPQQQKPDMKAIEQKLTQQLNAAWSSGAGYGAQAFCQVVKEKINKFEGEDLKVLLDDITDFVDRTLTNSPEELAASFENIFNRANNMLGKDSNNAE